MDRFPKIPGYRFENKFGQGRIADVYQAVKESTGQNVVIKILLHELIQAEDNQFPQRFIQEAQKAGKLDHPNIVKIIDAGVINDNYYFVMEYMPENLRMRIVNMHLSSGFESGRVDNRQNSSTMPAADVREIIEMFKQVLDALDYAHQQEIFHGDIRPENIFLKTDSVFVTPVIVDFNIQPLAAISDVLKKQDLVVKDSHYTCPEDILKMPKDNTCDYYNLGIVFFEMLTGHVPYEAEDKYALEKLHVEAPIPQLPDHVFQFQPLLNCMMAKDSSDRPESPAELMLMLEEFSDPDSPLPKVDDPDEEEPYELEEEIPSIEEEFPPVNECGVKKASDSSFELEEEILPTIEKSHANATTYGEIGNSYGEIENSYGEIEKNDPELYFNTNDNIKNSKEPGLGQEIEMPVEIEDKKPSLETGLEENLEIGEEFRKEIKAQLKRDLHSTDDLDDSALIENDSHHPFETGLRNPTLGVDDSSGILAKLKNPRVLIPIAAGILIIVALAVIFLITRGKSASPGQPKEQEIAGNTAENTNEDAGESNEKHVRYLKQAQRSFEQGDYEKALLQITEAEKIKNSPETGTLKKQIEAKAAEKLDDKMYREALKTGTAASLEEYLNKYPSGRHAPEAREKMDELNQIETKRSEERRKWTASRVVLRSTPQTLDKNAVKEMVKKRGFFEKYYNSNGNFTNHYELLTINNQKVVNDYATGLMWHQSGSLEYMKYEKIKPWLNELNGQKYAGFSDWRLPTLEEAASLMESVENKDALYIDALFFKEQNHTWTADKYNEIKAWAVDIFGGDFNPIPTAYDSFVRPVRTMK